MYNQEIIKKIVQLRDVENYSFSKIGREIAILVKRDKPYDHKTVISIYKNYKYTRREELKEKPPTQRELLNKHIDTLIDLKHNYNYSLRQISHKLGSNLIGKPFDLNVIGQVYKEHISKQNLIPPKSSIKLLEENITEILSMLDCNISLREIANRLTKKLNPNKPFHHNQITKVVNKYKK
ncbi:hypothetical protein PR262_14050 [Clostridioides difficile]|nr:hypothetical protein [Clostridioides difficile]